MQTSRTLYASPFSKAYWRVAAAEFRSTRTMVFAALMIALRVVFKAIRIPVGPYLDINTAFLVNALGAMSFGPVVAVAAATITDTLGCLLFPSGPYFFPFIFTEILGSLIFALLLYRTKVTVWRVVLARFLIDFLVNIVVQTPIMAMYYSMVLGRRDFAWIDLPRIIKNLVLFPVEGAVLVVFLRYAVPPLNREGYMASTVESMTFTKKTVALLTCLTVIGTGCVAWYMASRYSENKSLTAEYSADERFRQNERMNAVTLEKYPELNPETTVTVIDSAYSSFLSPTVTYEVSVYEADPEAIAARAAAKPVVEAVSRGVDRVLVPDKAGEKPDLTRTYEADVAVPAGGEACLLADGDRIETRDGGRVLVRADGTEAPAVSAVHVTFTLEEVPDKKDETKTKTVIASMTLVPEGFDKAQTAMLGSGELADSYLGADSGAAAAPNTADMRTVRGYSKSKPAKDSALTKRADLGYTRVEAKTSYNTVMILLVLTAVFLAYQAGKYRGSQKKQRRN